MHECHLEKFVEIMVSVSTEVFAVVLGYMYPEMTPDEYKKVVIKVYSYGPNKNYSFTFDVTDKGTFAYTADSLTEF